MDNATRSLKILVVDDTAMSRMVLCEFLQTLGHQAMEAVDGHDAMVRFLEFAPDLVLMDLMMPAMDGIEATRAIRTLPGANWVPIILLSAWGSQDQFVAALNAGCDDCLAKPINFPLLEAKINALQRIAEMQQEIDKRGRELQKFYAYAEEELSLTEHIMSRLVRREPMDNRGYAQWTEAAFGASGDILATTRSDNSIRYAMLADATGHGLAAAVTLIPVTNVFYAMTAKGFGIASIIEEMNRQVRSYCPIERFVAVTLIAVNTQNHLIEVWNGGNPPLLALAEDGREVRRFRSRHLPLGILTPDRFSSETEFLHHDQALQLVLFSDGLIEAGSGEQFGIERVAAALTAYPPARRLPALRHAFRDFIGDATPHDDISFALLDCPLADTAGSSRPATAPSIGERDESDEWTLLTTLSAAQLKSVDVVPLVVEWAHAMGLPKQASGNFFLVVTELFVNALEHGLLGMDSALKQGTDGFERYIELRNERLQNLREGQIQVALNYRSSDAGDVLRIHLKDSGNGFNYMALTDNALNDTVALSGRGIALVRSLCQALEYRDNGSEVYAEMLLGGGTAAAVAAGTA